MSALLGRQDMPVNMVLNLTGFFPYRCSRENVVNNRFHQSFFPFACRSMVVNDCHRYPAGFAVDDDTVSVPIVFSCFDISVDQLAQLAALISIIACIRHERTCHHSDYRTDTHEKGPSWPSSVYQEETL